MNSRTCRKCQTAIRVAGFRQNGIIPDAVAEKNCEFWAHKDLNRITESFERQAAIAPEGTWE